MEQELEKNIEMPESEVNPVESTEPVKRGRGRKIGTTFPNGYKKKSEKKQ